MEEVLVVAREHLFEEAAPQGFFKDPELMKKIYKHSFFKNRDEVEADESLKQIIPYCLVTNQGKIFLVKRKDTQGEARLHNKMSIGIGGHINDKDARASICTLLNVNTSRFSVDSKEATILRGMQRELWEELYIPYFNHEILGFINDDSDAVGTVHLGILIRIEALPKDNPNITVNEPDLMSGDFADIQSIEDQYDELESWSKIALKANKETNSG